MRWRSSSPEGSRTSDNMAWMTSLTALAPCSFFSGSRRVSHATMSMFDLLLLQWSQQVTRFDLSLLPP